MLSTSNVVSMQKTDLSKLTGMIRACTNRCGKIRYELFYGYMNRSSYQTTKTNITCPLLPPKILYEDHYCVPHTCTRNLFVISTPIYNGYNMENICENSCDMQEPKNIVNNSNQVHT